MQIKSRHPVKKVIAVLPAFNAEKTLQKTFAAIPQQHVHEVILVDDASTDNTVARAQEIGNLIIVLHKKNRGYGGNQKTCYNEALKRQADIIVMIHPDFQYDPSYIPKLVAPLLKGTADLAIGSRFLDQDPRNSGMAWWRYWGNRLLTTLQNQTLDINLSECHSGYRAYNRKLLTTVPYNNFTEDFAFDAQMLAFAARRNFRLAEIAIPTRYTTESSSASFTASVKYGIQTLFTLLPE